MSFKRFPTHLLQDGGQHAALGEAAPARDGGALARQQRVVGRQADGRDVRRELQRRVQLHQRQVVLVRVEVVLRVHRLARHAALHVRELRRRRREVELAHAHPYLRR